MKIRIKLLLFLVNTCIHSMELQKLDSTDQKFSGFSHVSSLEHLAIKKITDTIAIFPINDSFDYIRQASQLLSVECPNAVQQNFIYTYGLKQKISNVKVLGRHKEGIPCLAENNVALCSGSYDGIIKIWDKKTEECFGILSGHQSSIFSLALSKNDKFLYSGAQKIKKEKYGISEMLYVLLH